MRTITTYLFIPLLLLLSLSGGDTHPCELPAPDRQHPATLAPQMSITRHAVQDNFSAGRNSLTELPEKIDPRRTARVISAQLDWRTVRSQPLAAEAQWGKRLYVDWDHFVFAHQYGLSAALQNPQRRASLLDALGMNSSGTDTEIEQMVYDRLAAGNYTKELIDLINNGSYENPELRNDMYGQSDNASAQGVQEAISNGIDAILSFINAEPDTRIGQFSLGIKQLAAWLKAAQAGAVDRLEVYSRTADSPAIYFLSLIRDAAGAWYICIDTLAEQQLPSPETAAALPTHGTIVEVSCNVPLDREEKQEIITEARERFAFQNQVSVFTRLDEYPEQLINDFHEKKIILPAEKSGQLHRGLDSMQFRVLMHLGRHTISIIDTGCGMDSRRISAMLVPRRGNKTPAPVNVPEELKRISVIQDKTMPRQRILFGRNRERIMAVDAPSDILPQALSPGALFVDLGRLLPAQVSRKNFVWDENFAAGIRRVVDELSAHPSLSPEDRLRDINTILTGIDALTRGNAHYEFQAAALRVYARDRTRELRRVLLAQGYRFLPHQRQFAQLSLSGGSRVIFLHEDLCAWQGVRDLEQLGGVVLEGIFIPAELAEDDQRRPVVLAPFQAESLQTQFSGDTWLNLPALTRCPLLKTPHVVAAPLQCFGILADGQSAFAVLARKRLRSGLSDAEQDTFNQMLQVLGVMTAMRGNTGYNAGDTAPPLIVQSRQHHQRESDPLDAGPINHFLRRPWSDPTGTAPAATVPGDAQLRYLVRPDHTVVEIDTGETPLKGLRARHLTPLQHGYYLIQTEHSTLLSRMEAPINSRLYTQPGERARHSPGGRFVYTENFGGNTSGSGSFLELTDTGDYVHHAFAEWGNYTRVFDIRWTDNERYLTALAQRTDQEGLALLIYDRTQPNIHTVIELDSAGQDKNLHYAFSANERFALIHNVNSRHKWVVDLTDEKTPLYLNAAQYLHTDSSGHYVVYSRAEQTTGQQELYLLCSGISVVEIPIQEVQTIYTDKYPHGIIYVHKKEIAPYYLRATGEKTEPYIFIAPQEIGTIFFSESVSLGESQQPYLSFYAADWTLLYFEPLRADEISTARYLPQHRLIQLTAHNLYIDPETNGHYHVEPGVLLGISRRSDTTVTLHHFDAENQKLRFSIYEKDSAEGWRLADTTDFFAEMHSSADYTIVQLKHTDQQAPRLDFYVYNRRSGDHGRETLDRNSSDSFNQFAVDAKLSGQILFDGKYVVLINSAATQIAYIDVFRHELTAEGIYEHPRIWMNIDGSEVFSSGPAPAAAPPASPADIAWQKIQAQKPFYIATARSGYTALLAAIEKYAAVHTGSVREVLRSQVRTLYETQETHLRDWFAGLPRNADLSDTDTTAYTERSSIARFQSRMADILHRMESDPELWINHETYLKNLASGLFSLAAGNYLLPENSAALAALGYGWLAADQQSIDALPALTELLESLAQILPASVPEQTTRRLRLVQSLYDAVKDDPESGTARFRRKATQLLRLPATPRRRFLNELARCLRDAPQDKNSAQRLEEFIGFLTGDGDLVRERSREPVETIRELTLPHGTVAVSQLMQLEHLRPAAEPGSVMSMRYLETQLQRLPPRNAQDEAAIQTYVEKQAEADADTREIWQNTLDAGGSLELDFFLEPGSDGEMESVEQAVDNGTGALEPAALLMKKSTKSASEQKALAGIFGIGKYTSCRTVDRLRYITNNAKEAWLYEYAVSRDADGNFRSLSIVRMSALDPAQFPRGTTLQLRTTLAHTLPGLERMRRIRAWKNFCGLAQTETQKIYLVEPFQDVFVTGPEIKKLFKQAALPQELRNGLFIPEGSSQYRFHESFEQSVSAATGLTPGQRRALYAFWRLKHRVPLTVEHQRLAEIPYIDTDRESGNHRYAGSLRVEWTKDLPAQLRDGRNLLARAITDEDLEFIPAQWRPYVRRLGLNISLPLPLTSSRDAFEDGDTPLRRREIRRHIALGIYQALAFRAYAQRTPPFTFYGFADDWRTSTAYDHFIDNGRDMREIGLYTRLNRLLSLVESGASSTELLNPDLFIDDDDLRYLIATESADNIDRALRFLFGLNFPNPDREKSGPFTSLLAERIAYRLEALAAEQNARARLWANAQRLGVQQTDLPHTAANPLAAVIRAQARQAEETNDYQPENHIVTPGNQAERQLLSLAKTAGRAFGITDIVLVEASAPFIGLMRGKTKMFLNRRLADTATQLETDATITHYPLFALIHEFAHALEKMYRGQLTPDGEMVLEPSGLTHQAEGPFHEAEQHDAFLIAYALWGMPQTPGLIGTAAVQGMPPGGAVAHSL